jgi:hypothetical protein
MQEVVITGEKKLRRTNTVGMGIQQLSASQIKKIPAFMGEPDVVKALLTLPGVTTVGEALPVSTFAAVMSMKTSLSWTKRRYTILRTCWVSSPYSIPMP